MISLIKKELKLTRKILLIWLGIIIGYTAVMLLIIILLFKPSLISIKACIYYSFMLKYIKKIYLYLKGGAKNAKHQISKEACSRKRNKAG